MWLRVMLFWAAAVLIFYEVKFPLAVGEAFRAVDESFQHMLPVLGPGFLVMTLMGLKSLWAVAVFVAVQVACWEAGRLAGVWLAFISAEGQTGRLRWLSVWLLGWAGAGL